MQKIGKSFYTLWRKVEYILELKQVCAFFVRITLCILA